MKQLDLFGESGPAAPPEYEEDCALAARVPSFIALGTSTWTFPGWRGIFYPRDMSSQDVTARGLSVYARNPLFRTVGIDRSYYAPLGEAELVRYREDVPEGFLCTMKVWSGIVTREDLRTGALTPTFLDSRVFLERVLSPLERAFAKNLGVLLFVFSPMRGAGRPSAEEFSERLDRFLSEIPKVFPCAVELRNPELLTGSYLRTLARHGASHVLGSWERMPSIKRQLAVPSIMAGKLVVCRLSIRPGDEYAERKRVCHPFDRLISVDEEMRAGVLDIARRCAVEGRRLFVIVNNKMEGSAPLTVRALGRRIADAFSPP